ncbi:MAG: hypothetical protein MJ085_04330 [Clostridia bacterium]|nr:hypothetical protein [Clostridia bacterium]
MSDKTKSANGKRPLILLLSLFLILAVILIVVIVRILPGMKKPQKKAGPAVVLTSNNCSLTNEAFAFYYWGEYLYYLNQVDHPPFDTSRPLSEQPYDDSLSWQDYLIRQAMLTAEQTIAFSEAAEAEGFTLPEEYQAQMDEQIQAHCEQASQVGLELGAYLESRYGKGATEDFFRDYLYRTSLATAYTDHLYNSFVFTPTQADAYLEKNRSQYENLDGYGDTSGTCSLRCIFLRLKPGVSEQQLKDQAEMFYTEWQKDPTEEAFAKLAAVYNEDDGCTDGLYSAVYPGLLEPAVDSWCFSKLRKPGDCVLLPTDDGYVLVYYVTFNMLNRQQLLCEPDLRYETFRSTTTQLIDNCNFLFYPELVELNQPSQ